MFVVNLSPKNLTLSVLLFTAPAFAGTTLPPIQHISMGTGLDSRTLSIKLPCIERAPIISNRTLGDPAGDQSYRDAFDAKVISSAEEIIEQMDAEVKASIGLGLFSASAEAKFSRELKLNENYLYMLVKVSTYREFESLDPLQIRLTREARETLDRGGLDAFQAECGNEVVVSRRTGGKFMALVEIKTHNRDQKQDLGVKLSGSYLGLGSASASLNTSLRAQLAALEQTVKMVTTGTPIARPDFEQVIEFGRNFTQEVARAAQPTVIEYHALPFESVVRLEVDGEHHWALHDHANTSFWNSMAKYHIKANSLKNRLEEKYDTASQEQRVVLDTDLDRIDEVLNLIRTTASQCLQSDGENCRYKHRDFRLPVDRQEAEETREEKQRLARIQYGQSLYQAITRIELSAKEAKNLIATFSNKHPEDSRIRIIRKGDLIQNIVRRSEASLEIVRFLSSHYFTRDLSHDQPWIDMCLSGSVSHWKDRVHTMIGSPEFGNHYPSRENFVPACFQYLCGRNVSFENPEDKGGLAHWCAHYNNVGRLQMLTDFIGNQEIVEKITARFIQHYLNRPARTEEIQRWTPHFKTRRLDDILVDLLNEEYPNFVASEDPQL